MEAHHKAAVPLRHRVGVTPAIDFLVHRLACDNWYVACHREHLFVIHLTRGGLRRFAACCECTSPAEKGITHESQLTSVSIVPLGEEPDLSPVAQRELGEGLSELGRLGMASESSIPKTAQPPQTHGANP